MASFVSIIVPCYKSKFWIKQFAESMIEDIDYELIVVDDACPEETWRMIGFPQRVVRHCQNLGFAAAINSGMEQAKGEYILLSEADVRLSPHCLELLLAQLRADESIGMVGPVILGQDGYTVQSLGIRWDNRYRSYRPSSDMDGERDGLTTCFLMRNTIPLPFADSEYTSKFWMYLDLAQQIKRMNKTVLLNDVSAVHHGKSCFNKNNWHDYKMNKDRFFGKWPLPEVQYGRE
ncbi:MAG: glycosyltransferase [Candidatus Obscuribacterales bacterium]|nr:glycosyltransferase [Candidatus Obscuribacterales bacterium]